MQLPKNSTKFKRDKSVIEYGDSFGFYKAWDKPTVIISDGPYGLGSFPGETRNPDELANWYAPHLSEWFKHSLPSTTLWFWNSELGWASTHLEIVKAGWEFRNCHIWNKGIAHIAGNANSKTLRKFPVTTEVCAQYVKRVEIPFNGNLVPLREWLRLEWERTGLPFSRTNEACGVKNAATRKYFTKDHMWYFPPSDAMIQLAEYANKHGKRSGRPYFSLNGTKPVTAEEWELMRAKFYCDIGITNVWDEPAVRGIERLKTSSEVSHMNQKPLRLMELIIEASSDAQDVVWEPFGGLCTASIAAHKLKRASFAGEINRKFFEIATERLSSYDLF